MGAAHTEKPQIEGSNNMKSISRGMSTDRFNHVEKSNLPPDPLTALASHHFHTPSCIHTTSVPLLIYPVFFLPLICHFSVCRNIFFQLFSTSFVSPALSLSPHSISLALHRQCYGQNQYSDEKKRKRAYF